MKNLNYSNKDIIIHPNDHKNPKDWQNIFSFLSRSLDYGYIDSVLDLGAGTGNISYNFINKDNSPKCLAIDIDNNFLDSIKNRDVRIEVLNHDINLRLPFDDNFFDLVSCLGTLHYGYIRNPHDVIAEMKRVSKKYILVDFLLRDSLYSFFQRIRYPKYAARKHSRKEIESIIRLFGLRVGAVRGGRAIFPDLLPYSGREVFYILEI